MNESRRVRVSAGMPAAGCTRGGALSFVDSRTIQDFLPADPLLTRIEMSDGYQDTGGAVQFRVPRDFAEDIDLCAVVATQRVPLTQENIDRLVNPYGET